MNLHKCIVWPGIRTSERFGQLNFFLRDFFYGLLSAAHKGGWFEANAGILRAALFAPCLGKVSERDVKDGLLKLREVGLIKLWTGRNGRAYGAIENYRQRYDYGEDMPDGARAPNDELPLDAYAPEVEPPPKPPPRPLIQTNELKRVGVERARRAAPTPTELREDALARLAIAFPHVNVLSEFEKAGAKNKGRVDLLWFEKHWLPNCGVVVECATARKATTLEPEPEAWTVWLEERYPGNAYGKGGAMEGTRWN